MQEGNKYMQVEWWGANSAGGEQVHASTCMYMHVACLGMYVPLMLMLIAAG